MAKRKINGFETDALLGVALLGAGYFFVVKPLMNTFGGDQADQDNVNNQLAAPADSNPFDPNYQPFVDYFQQSNPGISIGDYMHTIAGWYNSNDPQLQQGSQAWQTADWGEKIKAALSWWNFTPDTQTVISIFNQVGSKTQVAAIAAYLNFNYDKELLHFLHFGGNLIAWIPNGLTEKEVSDIVTRVNSLPD